MSLILDETWRDAIIRNDLTALKHLFDQGYNPNKPMKSINEGDTCTANNNHVPAIVFASVSDKRLPLLKTLHDYCKVDVSKVLNENNLALVHVAAECGSLEVLKILVGWGADLHAVYGRYDISVAHEAAQFGQLSVLRWLFETDQTFLRKTLNSGYTPACRAVLFGQQSSLKVCFDFGYDVNELIIYKADANDEGTKMSLLDLVAYQGNDKIAKFLRKKGAKVTHQTVELAKLGATYPTVVRDEGNVDCDDISVQEIVDKKVMAKMERPISRTVKTLQQKLLSKLCDYCGDSNPGVPLLSCSACQMVTYCNRSCQKSHWKGHKPLCKAHQRGEEIQWPDKSLALRLGEAIEGAELDRIRHIIEIERFNLEDEVNKWNICRPSKMTALQYAVCCKRKSILKAQKVVELLVELGADLEAKVPERGRTALFVAQNAASIEMMKCLHRLGADINAKDENEQTILHVATAHSDKKIFLQMAKMIVSWDGFDLNARDMLGNTALGTAKMRNKKKMVQLLTNLGLTDGADMADRVLLMMKSFGIVDPVFGSDT